MTDREPASIPGVLSFEQVLTVWRVLVMFVNGKTKREVARALGYSRKYVAAVRDGEVRPSVHFAARLAAAIGTDLQSLLGIGGTS